MEDFINTKKTNPAKSDPEDDDGCHTTSEDEEEDVEATEDETGGTLSGIEASVQSELARLHLEVATATEEEEMPGGELHPEMQAYLDEELERVEREIHWMRGTAQMGDEGIEWHTMPLVDLDIIVIEDAEEQVDSQEAWSLGP